jgi:hypothetical protein
VKVDVQVDQAGEALHERERPGPGRRDAQMSLVADLFMYRPSFFVWLLQRFYYGSELPGRITDKKKGYTDSLIAAVKVTTSDQTHDGWRLAAKRKR